MNRYVLLLILCTLLNLWSDENVFKTTQMNSSKVEMIDFENVAIVEEKITDFSQTQNLQWKHDKNGIFGRIDSIAVVKIVIENDTDEKKSYVLRHSRPGIDEIDVWILRNNSEHLTHWVAGDRNSLDKRALKSINSAFPIELVSYEKIEIIAQLYTSGVMDINFELLSKDTFEQQSKWQVIWWGVFSGIMLVLIIYNLVSYFGSREFAYLIHGFYSFSVLINYACLYGFVYYMEIIPTLKYIDMLAYIFPNIALAFHVLYPIVFFKIKSEVPKLYRFMLASVFMFTLFALYFSFGVIDDEIYDMMRYISPFIGFYVLFIFGASLYFVYKKFSGSFFYLLAQIFVAIGAIYATMAVNTNLLGMSLDAAIVTSAIALMEVLFITIGLAYRVRKEFQEKEFLARVSKLYERYIYIGSYSSDIIHQWKSPLNHLGSEVALLYGYHKEGIMLDDIHYEKHLNELQKITDDLKNISNEVYGYLHNNAPAEEFELVHLIKNVSGYLGKDIKGIEIINLDHEVKVVSARAAFSQILLVLLSNSVKIFQLRKIERPQIRISFKVTEDTEYRLLISDNGGGVEEEIVKRIFEPYISSTNSLGSGLFVAKKLAQEKLQGDLKLLNSNENGATFELSFKKL